MGKKLLYAMIIVLMVSAAVFAQDKQIGGKVSFISSKTTLSADDRQNTLGVEGYVNHRFENDIRIKNEFSFMDNAALFLTSGSVVENNTELRVPSGVNFKFGEVDVKPFFSGGFRHTSQFRNGTHVNDFGPTAGAGLQFNKNLFGFYNYKISDYKTHTAGAEYFHPLNEKYNFVFGAKATSGNFNGLNNSGAQISVGLTRKY